MGDVLKGAGVAQADVHPTAIVDGGAVLGDGVEVGAGAYVGPGCEIGDGTRVMMGGRVMAHVVMGRGNIVHPGAVIGGDPQDRKYDPACPGRVVIGDRNVFREGVTVNRSVGEGPSTIIGDDCYLMACAHVGHNCVVGDDVNMANIVCLAGHVRVGSGCFLSAGCGVHQFTTIGDLVMVRGLSAVTQHVPPFVIMGKGDKIVGLNKVGLERSGRFTAEELRELREAFRRVYRPRVNMPMGDIMRGVFDRDWGRAAERFLVFIRDAMAEAPPRARGVTGGASRRQ